MYILCTLLPLFLVCSLDSYSSLHISQIIIIIIIIIIILWLCSQARAMASLSTRFLDHTQRRATVGRTLWTSDQLVAENISQISGLHLNTCIRYINHSAHAKYFGLPILL
jgi:hypothetical protein